MNRQQIGTPHPTSPETAEPAFTLNVDDGKLVVHAAVDSKMLRVLIKQLTASVEWLEQVEQQVEAIRRTARGEEPWKLY